MILPHYKLKINRHDLSEDRSLKAFSAVDELLLEHFQSEFKEIDSVALYNDRFGFLTCNLRQFKPTTIYNNKSQLSAIKLNIEANQLHFNNFSTPFSQIENKLSLGLIKVPKSLALFELYLLHAINNSGENLELIAGFMTKHFSKKLIEIVEKYFEIVEQSQAKKKARVVLLSKKRKVKLPNPIDSINYNETIYQQYWGVFSAKHIDYATQYLLSNIELNESESEILDLASGNGVIAKEISKKLPNANFHLIDDSILAVESSKLNFNSPKVSHYCESNLSGFEANQFDLIASNPPFHFEHEINIQIPIQLFKECYRCLKVGGSLQLVANNHLNYKTHLARIFKNVEILAQNESFTVIRCNR